MKFDVSPYFPVSMALKIMPTMLAFSAWAAKWRVVWRLCVCEQISAPIRISRNKIASEAFAATCMGRVPSWSMASTLQYSSIRSKMVELGVDPNAANLAGQTILHLVCGYEQESTIFDLVLEHQ